MNTNMN